VGDSESDRLTEGKSDKGKDAVGDYTHRCKAVTFLYALLNTTTITRMYRFTNSLTSVLDGGEW
jgi:hypothetical protein